MTSNVFPTCPRWHSYYHMLGPGFDFKADVPGYCGTGPLHQKGTVSHLGLEEGLLIGVQELQHTSTCFCFSTVG